MAVLSVVKPKLPQWTATASTTLSSAMSNICRRRREFDAVQEGPAAAGSAALQSRAEIGLAGNPSKPDDLVVQHSKNDDRHDDGQSDQGAPGARAACRQVVIDRARRHRGNRHRTDWGRGFHRRNVLM